MNTEVGSDEAQEIEFETYAQWTQEAVHHLGSHVAVAAACRGSGSPAVLDWLLDRLAPTTDELLLDIGGGMGGPAAYAAERTGARMLVLDPSREACVAAKELFGFEAVVSSATAVPLPSRIGRVAWSVGVLCTMEDQAGLLAESVRVLCEGGTLGLYVLVRQHDSTLPEPDGNNFPTGDRLAQLVEQAGLTVVDRSWVSDLDDPGPDRSWREAERQVEDLIAERHGQESAYTTAHEQSDRITNLLDDGALRAMVLTCRV